MWYTFDTETRGLFGKIFAWRAYDGQHLIAGEKGEEAVKWLMSLSSEDHIYIHNLDFDLAKLMKSFLFVDLDDCTVINRKFARATIIDGPTLHCSWHILRSSLANLSKSFDLGADAKRDLQEVLPLHGYRDKHDFFKRVKADDPLLSEYLDYDVISLHKIIAQLMDYAGLGEKFFRINTTPQLAMKVFQANFKADYKALTSQNVPYAYDDFCRDCYIGADTQMFRPHMEHAGYHYDINSLYPFVMEAYEYPYGACRYEEGELAKSIFGMTQKYPDRYPAYLVEATVSVPKKEKYPSLPVHLADKLIFPVGEITGHWTKPELEYALSRGAKVLDIHRILMWRRTHDYFSRFIAWAKQGKIESTGGKRQFYKDVMNSFYGKLGMSMIRQSYLKSSEENRERFVESLPVYEYESEFAGRFLEGWVALDPFKAPYVQPHIAAYVTAYARLELIKQIHHEEDRKNPVYYCDTDSIVVENPLEEIYTHDSDFGKWKMEAHIKEGIFLAPKLYAETHANDSITLKAKGVPKERREEEGFRWYRQALESLKRGQTKLEFYSGGKRRMKIISAMKRGEDLDRQVDDEKTFNFSRRQKRNVDWMGNRSKPWDAKVFYDEMREQEEAAERLVNRSIYRDAWMREHHGAPSLWWAVKQLGGVKKSSRYSVPKWMHRSTGKNLDELVLGVREWNFIFEDANQLLLALKDWKKYSIELY